MHTTEKEGTMTKQQAERIEAMRQEVNGLGGTITTYEDLPPHIEEEFLRQVLERPDRGQLHPAYPQIVE